MGWVIGILLVYTLWIMLTCNEGDFLWNWIAGIVVFAAWAIPGLLGIWIIVSIFG